MTQGMRNVMHYRRQTPPPTNFLYKSKPSAWPKRNCRFFAKIISCFLAFALIWHLSNWMFIATNRFLLSAFYGLILNLLCKIMARKIWCYISVDDGFQNIKKYQIHKYEFIYLRSGNFRMKMWCLKFSKKQTEKFDEFLP